MTHRWLGWVSMALVGCSTAGSTWMSESPHEADTAPPGDFEPPDDVDRTGKTGYMSRHAIGATAPERTPEAFAERVAVAKTQGKAGGTYRNTYYDFPAEADFEGTMVPLYNASCGVIDQVPKDFHDTLCVQGSGHLASGATVSFAKRNCACAAVCPKTSQKICFDELDKTQFPWGRGATGKPIVPLLTIAVDSDVIPLGTPVYIPEYDGVPLDHTGTSFHDGCFIAQDRGSRVKGKHVDIFTGDTSITELWNRLVPSNQGVSVIVGTQHCAR